MKLLITERTQEAVILALEANYFEGAVEAVFAEHPDATRNDVVDAVVNIERQIEGEPEL
jgi:hypothetical protein